CTELIAVHRVVEAADANQAALDVMRAYSPPPDGAAEYHWILAFVLFERFRRQLALEQADLAISAAVESIEQFRQAAAQGIDTPSVADQLRQLSIELTAAHHPTEAADANQAALDVAAAVT
ncbi:hypothetical protein, partial [Pseudonocardia yunnanensis]